MQSAPGGPTLKQQSANLPGEEATTPDEMTFTPHRWAEHQSMQNNLADTEASWWPDFKVSSFDYPSQKWLPVTPHGQQTHCCWAGHGNPHNGSRIMRFAVFGSARGHIYQNLDAVSPFATGSEFATWLRKYELHKKQKRTSPPTRPVHSVCWRHSNG